MIIIIIKKCYSSVEASIKYIEDFIFINRTYFEVRVVDFRVVKDYLVELFKYMMEIGDYFLNMSIGIGAGGICPSFNNVKGDILTVISNVIDFFLSLDEKRTVL